MIFTSNALDMIPGKHKGVCKYYAVLNDQCQGVVVMQGIWFDGILSIMKIIYSVVLTRRVDS